MSIDRRDFLASACAAVSAPAATLTRGGSVLRPEDFGAKADGITNDTQAFARLSAEVNKRGGGTVALAKGRTYVVGDQHRGGGPYGWNPVPILDLHGLSAPLRILGNSARLRAQSGLRFGTFDPETGEPATHAKPFNRLHELASAYMAMVGVEESNAPIEIRDLELDGNLRQLTIGGPFGDGGWQVPGDGIVLKGNLSTETIVNVSTHHHARDGLLIIGDPERTQRSRFSHLRSTDNARQGVSVTCGRGYDFEDCEFSHTGRAGLMSPPGAGIDIEAETRQIRDLTFARCKFVDNAGVGMLADSGNTEKASFRDCLFVGTTSWSAWPFKPNFSFDDCTFVGSIVHAFADEQDAARATRFTRCLFTDKPQLSPTGKVFTGGGPIANLAQSKNVLFDGCRFELVGDGLLPWSWRATYKDCRMSQASPKAAETKGRYIGRTTIHGRVDLYGSMIEGELVMNGQVVPRGVHGGKPW
jgi:hypothetical protein